MAKAARFIAFGTELGVAVGGGAVGGYYLDAYLGCAPLFMLLLTLGAMMGSMYRLLWTLKKFNSARRDD